MVLGLAAHNFHPTSGLGSLSLISNPHFCLARLWRCVASAVDSKKMAHGSHSCATCYKEEIKSWIQGNNTYQCQTLGSLLNSPALIYSNSSLIGCLNLMVLKTQYYLREWRCFTPKLWHFAFCNTEPFPFLKPHGVFNYIVVFSSVVKYYKNRKIQTYLFIEIFLLVRQHVHKVHKFSMTCNTLLWLRDYLKLTLPLHINFVLV